MAKLPPPPPALAIASVRPEVHRLGGPARLWRVYFAAGDHPTTWDQFRTWGPTTSRFDHHLPPARLQDRAILYAAAGPDGVTTALAEVFQESRTVPRQHKAPALVGFTLARPLKLLDLTGAWPTRAGASMALSTGRHDRARAWSQAIYEAFPKLDGLWYPSSMHANQPCVALYERAADAVVGRPDFHRQLSDPVLHTVLKNACRRIGYVLD